MGYARQHHYSISKQHVTTIHAHDRDTQDVREDLKIAADSVYSKSHEGTVSFFFFLATRMEGYSRRINMECFISASTIVPPYRDSDVM